MKEEKEKHTIPQLLVIGAFIFAAVYFAGKGIIKVKDTVIAKQDNEILSSEVADGTVYAYSEDEKNNLVAKYGDKDKEYRGLLKNFTGFKMKDYWTDVFMYSIDLVPEEKDMFDDMLDMDMYSNDYYFAQRLSQMNDSTFFSKLIDGAKVKGIYNRVEVSAGDVFNEDLTLKRPDLFTGFVKNYGAHHSDKIIDFGTNDYEFNVFVNNLKALDNAFASSNGVMLNSQLDEHMLTVKHNVLLECPDDLDNYVNNRAYKAKKYCSMDTGDFISVNKLQALLQAGSNNNRFISSGNNNPNNLEGLTFADSQFNYFNNDIHNQEKIYFYPSQVEKVNDDQYIITIETTAPVDKTSHETIFALCGANFGKIQYEEDDYTAVFNKNGFDISLRIKYKDDRSYDMATINDNQLSLNNLYTNKDYYGSRTVCEIEWYPNEEAQVWVDDYFARAKEALDNNEQFSFFQTIRDVADDNNANYKDVEGVIMTYYYISTLF